MTTATEVGHVEMRIAKVVGLGAADDELVHHVVLDEVAGDRQLVFAIGHAEASAWRLASVGSPGGVR